MSVKITKPEQSEITRTALLKATRALFAEQGFADTATEEIVKHADVTRGALYDQFRDKADLFRAVFEELDRARMKQISEARRTAQEDLTEAAIYIARADEMHAAREKMGQRVERLLAGIRVGHS